MSGQLPGRDLLGAREPWALFGYVKFDLLDDQAGASPRPTGRLESRGEVQAGGQGRNCEHMKVLKAVIPCGDTRGVSTDPVVKAFIHSFIEYVYKQH